MTNATNATTTTTTTKARKPRKPKAVTSFVTPSGVVVDLNVKGVPVDKILADITAADSLGYGANIRFAAKLNEEMPGFAWFDISHTEVSDNAKILAPFKAAFYKAKRDAGHKNPAVPFNRDICAYGRNLRAGLAPNGKTMLDGSAKPKGEGEGEGEGEGANPAKRSPKLRNLDELIKLWKFNHNLGPSAPKEILEVQKHLTAALKALNFDVRTIKTDK
jgi:hypothetical protein